VLWADQGPSLRSSSPRHLPALGGRQQSKSSPYPASSIPGWSGSFYVQRTSRSAGEVLFHAPRGHLAIDRDSMVRIDVLDAGATPSAYGGPRRPFRSSGASRCALAGQRVFVDPGLLPSLPKHSTEMKKTRRHRGIAEAREFARRRRHRKYIPPVRSMPPWAPRTELRTANGSTVDNS